MYKKLLLLGISFGLLGTGLVKAQTATQEAEAPKAATAQEAAVKGTETDSKEKKDVKQEEKKDIKENVKKAEKTEEKKEDKEKVALEADLHAAQNPEGEASSEGFVKPREEMEESKKAVKPKPRPRVVYNPKNRRDPTLSPDDFLLMQYREKQRLAAIEAERQRQLAEERRKREEAERLRQLELARIKDPTREVRNKIQLGGILGQEVFIGSKVYTVGNKIFGAKIVEVTPDEVVFSYKGHKFVKKMK